MEDFVFNCYWSVTRLWIENNCSYLPETLFNWYIIVGCWTHSVLKIRHQTRAAPLSLISPLFTPNNDHFPTETEHFCRYHLIPYGWQLSRVPSGPLRSIRIVSSSVKGAATKDRVFFCFFFSFSEQGNWVRRHERNGSFVFLESLCIFLLNLIFVKLSQRLER